MHDPITLRSDLAALWQDFRRTPLVDLPSNAAAANIGRVLAKLECERPLGNFKSLGGTLAGLRALVRATGASDIGALLSRDRSVRLPRLICASDGNHGLSVAAAARRAGTGATIFLPASVDAFRAARIESVGGEVKRVEGTYDDAVDQARACAARGEGLLIPDTSQDRADPVVQDVMSGYSIMTAELLEQFEDLSVRPTHAFVQAGVGGLAAAIADGLSEHPLELAVVEPESAACVAIALRAGRPVLIAGELKTSAEMLSCGLASAPALDVLLRQRAKSLLVGEALLAAGSGMLEDSGIQTTASGAAGVAGLMHVAQSDDLRRLHNLEITSVVLLMVTEAAAGDVLCYHK